MNRAEWSTQGHNAVVDVPCLVMLCLAVLGCGVSNVSKSTALASQPLFSRFLRVPEIAITC